MDDVVFFATLWIGNLSAESQNHFHAIEINVKVKGITEQNQRNNNNNNKIYIEDRKGLISCHRTLNSKQMDKSTEINHDGIFIIVIRLHWINIVWNFMLLHFHYICSGFRAAYIVSSISSSRCIFQMVLIKMSCAWISIRVSIGEKKLNIKIERERELSHRAIWFFCLLIICISWLIWYVGPHNYDYLLVVLHDQWTWKCK